MYQEGYYRGKKEKRRFDKDVDKQEPLHTDGRGCKTVRDKTLHDSTCTKVPRAVRFREKQGGPVKNIQRRKDTLFNKWCWENWSTTYKRMKTRTLSNTIHKNKLKMD